MGGVVDEVRVQRQAGYRVEGAGEVGLGVHEDVLAHVRKGSGGQKGVGVHSMAQGWVVEGSDAVDLRRVEIVDGVRIRSIGDLISRVLVGEGGVQAGVMGNVEDGVH